MPHPTPAEIELQKPENRHNMLVRTTISVARLAGERDVAEARVSELEGAVAQALHMSEVYVALYDVAALRFTEMPMFEKSIRAARLLLASAGATGFPED